MSPTNFGQFFLAATDYEPFDFQRRLAGGDGGRAAESLLISIPTGMGKTAAVVLAWLWNSIVLAHPAQPAGPRWPRRLVYCLPMRTLVEQTRKAVETWLKALLKSADEIGLGADSQQQLRWLVDHSPVVLMGGEDPELMKREWDIWPEKPCILIGTQDMLLSRALNRGYAMSRYRWPMHFGLLNNDCLWVMDEVQLMGPALATACQLEAFRRQDEPVSAARLSSAARFNSYPEGRSVTWYASATADPGHLQTRDWRETARPADFLFELSATEKLARAGKVAERRLATKRVEFQKNWNFGDKEKIPAPEGIDAIIGRHGQMTDVLKDASAELPRRTLIICNTVDRAVAVHAAIKAKLATHPEIDLLLMHSRFRSKEREEQTARLENPDIQTHPL